MTKASRRTFLGTSAAAPLLLAGMRVPHGGTGQISADLERYLGFGNKRAGGPGDNACGEWLAAELRAAGYSIERQEFQAPFFEAATAELTCGDATAKVHPQPIVIPTGANGISARLVLVDRFGHASAPLENEIALVELASARWSSIMTPAARKPIEAAFAGGARAAVAITNGPTGRVIALNADGRRPMFPGPVALLAPNDAERFLAAALQRQAALLTVTGDGGRRSAFNFVGRLDRGKGRWLAVSTPRSGWFDCAAERGSGVAAWLDLARWAPLALPDHDLAFVCNTGHEYEYLGAAEALKAIAPPVERTDFWLHIGANVAATDWHEIGATPLPSADSERYLSVSPSLLPIARTVFAGQIGYEAPVSSAVLSAGELDEVIKAGYRLSAGVFGIHRFHHTDGDDERCFDGPATAAAAAGFRRLLEFQRPSH